MNRLDRAVISGLVLVLVLATIAIAAPAFSPRASLAPVPTPPAATTPDPYREGILGRPAAVNPLAARTQADRDLVALAFEGLVGRDAMARPIPALAVSWTQSADGAAWTFRLDPAARWHDGESVTASDVAFTVRTLQDPAYHGPGAGSWTGITVTVADPTTVKLVLATPIAGFLELATQPIVPEHLLAGTAPGALSDDPFNAAPVGSGPYVIAELDRDHAVLELAPRLATPAAGGEPSLLPKSPDPLAAARPTPRPVEDGPGLARLEFRFFDSAAGLAASFRAGELDAVSGLDQAAALALTTAPGARGLRYPSTTLAAVALNLRPTRPTFADPRVRLALLQAIDRARIVRVPYGGRASRADGLIPPTSWAFSAAATPVMKRDLKAAAKSLTAAGWKKARDGWHRAGVTAAQTIELLVPPRSADPIRFAAGRQIAADWRAIGLTVKLVERDAAVVAADHLRTGDFEAALVNISIGHDPDLYPLLASSQTRTGGANVFGLQDPALDPLLVAARRPDVETARIAAFGALQSRLSAGMYLLPIAWPDQVFVLAERLVGPAPRPISDRSERFGGVLTWRLADDR